MMVASESKRQPSLCNTEENVYLLFDSWGPLVPGKTLLIDLLSKQLTNKSISALHFSERSFVIDNMQRDLLSSGDI